MKLLLTTVSIFCVFHLSVGSPLTKFIPSFDACFCTKELIPVCSSQNVQYPNFCVFKCETFSSPTTRLGCNGPCPCNTSSTEAKFLVTKSSPRPLPITFSTRPSQWSPSVSTEIRLQPTSESSPADDQIFTETEANTPTA